ncbi:hypothetical protein ARMSODRAFT_982222 [Armillaria solidipes]|uniref:Uncharacterized protein n=1 Tax=Armillaria solidipes TaxID=1076256 RepID=A0A2H3B7I8_9AGAR|nr:hypothetical protein ARMSODRAFT_982222 [Armillaria solidipes]
MTFGGLMVYFDEGTRKQDKAYPGPEYLNPGSCTGIDMMIQAENMQLASFKKNKWNRAHCMRTVTSPQVKKLLHLGATVASFDKTMRMEWRVIWLQAELGEHNLDPENCSASEIAGTMSLALVIDTCMLSIRSRHVKDGRESEERRDLRTITGSNNEQFNSHSPVRNKNSGTITMLDGEMTPNLGDRSPDIVERSPEGNPTDDDRERRNLIETRLRINTSEPQSARQETPPQAALGDVVAEVLRLRSQFQQFIEREAERAQATVLDPPPAYT